MYVRYRRYLCTGGSAEVIRKCMRPANIDFAGLDVSGEGKYPNAWCSAARVSLHASGHRRGRACGISVRVNKRRGHQLDIGTGMPLKTYVSW